MITRAELDRILDTATPPGLIAKAMGAAIVGLGASRPAEDGPLAEVLVRQGFSAAEVAAHLDDAKDRAGAIVAQHGPLAEEGE